MSTPGFRTFADQLRSWPDDRLARLLALRPDLATPAPHDSSQLASRATGRSSLQRAVDQLTRSELCVLHALAGSGETTEAEAVQPGPELDRLTDLGLVWESTSGPSVPHGLVGVVQPIEPADLPELAVSERDAASIDRAAAGAAFETVRHVELLLDRWGARPPVALRTGGLSVRDLKAAATSLQVEESTAALWIELAAGAGLLATGNGPDEETCWLPTDDFDKWTALPIAEQWAVLAHAWLKSPRLTALVGSRDSAGKTWNALAPELIGVHQVEARSMALAEVGALPLGTALASGTGVPSLVARIEWLRPRRPRVRADQVAWAVREASVLGVMGLGGLASYARGLLGGSFDADALAPLLPAPVDHVLLQADLTAIAPGPLETAIARDLHLVADVESQGGATVFRFTPTSVRRALDAGWSAAALHDFVAQVSRTPVPQPLTYLIDDIARRFGTVRVGFAEAFLRSDDETALTELLHHPQAASLGLRQLAPTVLISTVPIDVLLPRLRELGAAPVVEAPDGSVHVARPDIHRARTPRDRRPPAAEAARETARIAAVIGALRTGDRAAANRPATSTTPAGALNALRAAIEEGATVVIEYVDNHGVRGDRVISPIALEGGQLSARDHRVDDVRSFAVHRINAVRRLSTDE